MAFSPDRALKYLQRAHEQNRLAHAYLITGAAGSGKETLAVDLAELVNKSKSPNGSGVLKVNPESKSRRIVIEQVRELEHSLQMRASEGRRKIAIISEADRLMPQAANAFLKTLEEPPKDSLLLLLSALPELLPDTIRSRCISIPLSAKQATDATGEERGSLNYCKRSHAKKNKASKVRIDWHKACRVCSEKSVRKFRKRMRQRTSATKHATRIRQMERGSMNARLITKR